MKRFTFSIIMSLIVIGLAAQNLEVVGKAKITVMDTITSAQDSTATNVVRLSDGTLAVRQYQVGDYAQGGIIFWVDETGEHGLACDTSDISTDIKWYNDSLRVTNATGDGVGSGEMNTMLIVAQQTADAPDSTFAALICANLVRGSYGDWYLPSKEELNLMYQNKALIDVAAIANGGSGFASTFYWSSTEDNSNGAWEQYFVSGNQYGVSKSGSIRVRAVRAF